MTETSLGKEKIRVLLLESIDQSAVDAFKADGYTSVARHKTALSETELCAEIGGAHPLGIRSRTRVTRGVLERADKLIAVGSFGIGTQIGLLAEGLGMRVLYHDVEPKLALGNAQPVDTLRTLLEGADVVTLHVPDTARTFHLIAAEQLGWMKPTAHLINASRGNVVDLDALARVLDAGELAGAAIDVFPSEPESNAQPFESPLRRFDNVLLTPHIGGSTVEAQESIGLEVAAKLLKYSNNGSTVTAINFPEVSLPEHAGKHRLLHTHRNVPGMLAALNAVLAAAKINVASQYLETSRQVGYAVIDVDGADRPLSAKVRKQLDAIEGTIRTRVLY